MSFKLSNIVVELKKFWLKRTNKTQYQGYKQSIKDEKLVKDYYNGFHQKIEKIRQALTEESEINFKHSGHIGDLVYALPVIKEIAKTKKCNLYIRVNHSLGKKAYYKHPSGNIMINDRIFSMALPLLETQKYINSVKKWNNEKIDIDLDLFREFPFSNDFHSIRWYYHITGFQPDMSLPFIDAEPEEKFKDKIVVVRTFRGTNPLIDYSFLNKYDNLLFLGIKSEYENFVKVVPNTEFYDANSFLEIAQIMKAAKFVITNQTFAFALSEGLKVNRILEANPFIPAVFPIGDNGYDFYFQKEFEDLVQKMNN